MKTWNLIMAAAMATALCVCQARGGTIQSIGSGYWTNDATWSGGSMPASADDVTIQGGHTITNSELDTRYASNLTIQAGAVLTHLANSSAETHKLILDIAGNLTIQAGGEINVDNKGYAPTQGPGTGGSFVGGSYGGIGGAYSSAYAANRGTTYGWITAPTNCGSGPKGDSYPSYPGAGAVILTVGGASLVDGSILARATTPTNVATKDHQGSGGSVFLTTATLSGTGTIDAGATPTAQGAAGGGGRVAVVLTNSTDFGSVVMRAYGGNAGGMLPAGGTVYLQHKDHTAGNGKLIVDFGGVAPGDGATALQNGKAAASYEFSEIVLTNSGIYGLDTNDTLIATNTVLRGSPANRNDGIILLGGTLTVPAAFSYSNIFIRLNASSGFAPASSLTVGAGATLVANLPWTLNGPLTVGMGGLLTHDQNAETYKINVLVKGALDVQAGGEINVDGKGYGAGSGPGKAAGSGYGGGGYGGMGSAHGSYPDNFGATYGSVTAPTNCGSGANSSSGGGAVILRVEGATTLNGNVSARGASGSYQGSGGSVYLTTATLTGSGTIDAGSAGDSVIGTGGGGRIAVILTNGNEFGSVRMQAYCAQSSNLQGSPGTVYTQTRDQGPGKGTLLIDAKGLAPATRSSTLIWTNVTDTTVGTVIVTNSSKLVISNQTLTVNGSLENTATFSNVLNSTVYFAGTNAARIRGQNTFYNFVCTNIGEILSFQDARTNTVDGVLTLANVTLNSISGGQWYLKASASIHNVTNVNVSWSDARPGSQIVAFDSVDGSNNYAWVFGERGFLTNYWTGATDSDWTKSGNWSRNRSTQLSDTVVVTNGSPNYPLLQSATRILSLAVSNGASLGLTNFNLVVDDDVRVAGTLTASGTENLTVGGDLDFTDGTFNAATSTVWIAGSNSQTVVSAGESFRNLMVSNSAAPVMFTDAVSATNIVNYSTPITFGGAVAAQTSIRTVGTNVIFGGAVTTPSFYNRNGGLVFGSTLNTPLFYSENGALVFTGAVTAASFTNWYGDATFHDDITSDRFFCAPGGMNIKFQVGKVCTVGDLELYGRGGYPVVLRSLDDGKAWDLNVTNWSNVRHVDVRDSNAEPGQTIYPLASANSGGNTNWDFGNPWQTWVGTSSMVFTSAANWVPSVAPDAGTRLLIDGFYATAPVLSGALTAAQVIVGGNVTTSILTVNGLLATVGDLDVQSKGTITHAANGATEANKLYLTVGGNLTVHGAIDVDNKGYGIYEGPGKALARYTGGSYGGIAATYLSPYPDGRNLTYGSITAPTNCGSGSEDRNGGGAAILTVNGDTAVMGSISARSWGGVYPGSGGSIFLTTGTLSGTGTLDAGVVDGGTAPGGGGRIAVIVTNGTAFGSVALRAFGGVGAHANKPAAGTIYLQHKDQGPGNGILLVNANGVAPMAGSSTLIHGTIAGTTVGAVILTNQAVLAVSNATLTVQGDWRNRASFIAQTNSTVDFAGATVSTIYTNNTFFNLTCTNAGKTLVFEAGRTNTVTGLLKLGGAHYGQFVTLQSTTPGSWSYLTLVPGGTQTIARVSVKDNNAGGGQKLLAGVGSANGGNNINWQFPPSGTMFMVK